ncbi:MAG: Cof-type HAD-IIB family hydrolase [Candidatus Tectomicrobia bacterium]|nr:Cof-type HAD-IIB family hydrolase [Candidatus Tectomicrobia bacterium]
MPYRLLALDVDGTILDPDGELRDAVRQAVMAARQAGLRVVLCTGRRFRSTRPVAQDLRLDGPVVVHNGALVKDVVSAETLHCHPLPESLCRRGLEVLRQLAPPLIYIDAFHEEVDILTEHLEHLHPFQQEYLQDNIPYCRFVDDLAATELRGVVMLSIMAEADRLRALRPVVEDALAGQGHTKMILNKNFRGHILEVLPATVSKWQALERLMAAEGIAPDDVVAIGDDYNDLEMIQGAGLGIAMGNAVEPVRAAAGYVTGSNDDDGVVQAIERFVLRR